MPTPDQSQQRGLTAMVGVVLWFVHGSVPVVNKIWVCQHGGGTTVPQEGPAGSLPHDTLSGTSLVKDSELK